MSDAFLIQKNTNLFTAVINVTYPAGAVCTCTMGGRTYTAKDTSGSATFKVRKAGTWVVAAVDGSSTDSVDVVITQDGQQESVTLKFSLSVGELPEGTLIKLNENGSGVNFYLAKHDYESGLNGAGRELVVRKDCYDNRSWHTTNSNVWTVCSLLSWLKSTYKGMLDATVQEMIGTTKYYYTHGNGNTTIYSRGDEVFQLSLGELGKTDTAFNSEGSALPIANTLGIAYMNGSTAVQWTRTPNNQYSGSAACINVDGTVHANNCSNARGSRPAFTLPTTALVNPTPNPDGSYTLIV